MENKKGPPGKLILIVDDEKDVCELIGINTEREGFRTATANSADDASAMIEQEAPDLIVLDLMMPRQSGYEFLRNLQATGHGRIPVVVITARQMDASTVTMIRQEANVVEFFSKPFNMPQFLSALHRHLKTAGSPPRQKRP